MTHAASTRVLTASADHSHDDAVRAEKAIAPLLSVIAGMVDLSGFFTLGNIFTAHVTGNLVLAAATAAHGQPAHLATLLAIPIFMLALAAAWLIAQACSRHGFDLVRVLLIVQCLLLILVCTICVTAKPSADPRGHPALLAAMIAVSAMAVQYSLFRLALPGAVSTAVMTGNLSNLVLSFMDLLSTHPLMAEDRDRLKRSALLLAGFLVGCVVAAVAVILFRDWAWCLPAAMATAVAARW